MTEQQFNRLYHMLTFMFVGTIFAIRAVSKAVDENTVWESIYGFSSLFAWTWALIGYRLTRRKDG
jgi:hypothetical protein